MRPASAVHFAPVVIAPTYNNARTLSDVVNRILDLDHTLIAVNDGSTDDTAQVLASFGEARRRGRLRVLEHGRNRGKAAALLSGFEDSVRAGYSHAVTIDTDGQHDPEDISSLLQAARDSPAGLVIGARSEVLAGYPGRSLLGRRLSNLMIWMECAAAVHDSQSGYRVYPLSLFEVVRCRSGQFNFETEIITRAVWAGFPVVEVPITSRYLPAGQRVSHFRPGRDTLRSIGMHARLLARRMWPWSGQGSGSQQRGGPGASSDATPALSAEAAPTAWRRLLAWLSPGQAWRQLRGSAEGRNRIAAGVAVGVFIANLPLYPCQTVLGLYVAQRLHLHPLSVVAGTCISTPPLGIALIALAVGIGHVLLYGRLPATPLAEKDLSYYFGQALLEWAVGGIVVGLVLAVLAFCTVRVVFGRSLRAKTVN